MGQSSVKAILTERPDFVCEFGPFRIDRAAGRLLRDGHPVPLTPKAFDVLLVLVENPGHLVEKDELMNRVWAESFVEEGNLKVTISMLRKALEEGANGQRYIETVPRKGYRFAADVKEFLDNGHELVVRERTRSSITLEEERDAGGQEPGKIRQATKTNLLNRQVIVACVVITGLAIAAYYLLRRPSQPAGQVRSLAVLPFKPIVADSRDESIELGMADTLINRLSNIRQIAVRPISAVRKYTGLEQDPVGAGRELQVDSVLDGSIQRSGEQIRVSVRLIRVADGAPLWANQFDEKYTSIFAVQDAISRKVATTLAVRLGGEEKRLLTKRYTENTEAYEAYLKGRYYWNKENEEGYKKGMEYFQQALSIDPDYALAHAGIADSYNMMGYWGVVAPKEAFPKAKAAANQALAIDETLAEAHASLAYAEVEYDWDFVNPEIEYRRALELNPNYATARLWYAEYLILGGRLDDGNAELKQAQLNDPLSQPISLIAAASLYYARQYDQAIEQLRKTVELDPNFILAYDLMGACYREERMYDQAVASYEKELTLEHVDPHTVASLMEAYKRSGMRGYWQRHIELLKQQSRQNYISPVFIAMDYAELGDKDQAIAWLAKAFDERSGWLLEINLDPTWDNLRTDPRFVDLIQRLAITH
jgi:DNA-binding winged helix-turn-helix (wHTH) protein/TolB-like protein